MHAALAELVQRDPSALPLAGALFDGLNPFLGSFVSELLGELFANAWFVVCALGGALGGPPREAR